MGTNRLLRNYLKMFRKRSGLSQRELALLLGCKHGSKVSRYERSERLPSPLSLVEYEAIFGKDAHELFAGFYEERAKEIVKRAQRLSREVDGQPHTPQNKQKFDFLTTLIFRLKRRS